MVKINSLWFFNGCSPSHLPTGVDLKWWKEVSMLDYKPYIPGIAVVTDVIERRGNSKYNFYQLLFNNSNGIRYVHEWWLENINVVKEIKG